MELEANLRAIAAAGYRVVLAPPLRLGGVGVALADAPNGSEDGWQGSAVSLRAEIVVDGFPTRLGPAARVEEVIAVGPSVAVVVAELARQVADLWHDGAWIDPVAPSRPQLSLDDKGGPEETAPAVDRPANRRPPAGR